MIAMERMETRKNANSTPASNNRSASVPRTNVRNEKTPQKSKKGMMKTKGITK
jgi:hypothetical protein